MSERNTGRRPPWPERDPRDTSTADQRPEEAPDEVAGDDATDRGSPDPTRRGRPGPDADRSGARP